MANILIVDDDPSVVASLALLLKRQGHLCRGASHAAEALAELTSHPPDLVLQDMNFTRGTSGHEGLELLADLRRWRPDLPVILITAWGTISLAVEGIKAGAADFVTKPWHNAQLVQTVETALGLAATRATRAAGATAALPSREELDRRLDLTGLVGRDPKFLKVLDLVSRVAPTDASVLLTGESGTGKELIAAALHHNSRRRERPFVKVNLGGISSTLFESEMFGHVRGAFTDARGDRKGRFEVADGGTLLLDEIGEVDPAAQVKLLRVLQDRTYEVLGSSITRTVDVRVISATNRDLPAMVAAGEFREDLFYRLNLIAIRLPALRERAADIPELARHALAEAARRYRRPPLTLTPGASAWLRAQSWPGNVRQLQQTLERAVLVVDGDRLEAVDLTALAALDESAPAATCEALPAPGSMTLDAMEKAMIERCLQHFGGNVSRVAEALGLSRGALYRRFEKHGLAPNEGA